MRGAWEGPSIEPPTPGPPPTEAVFLVPVEELRPWKVFAGLVIAVNGALAVVQAVTIWALWRML